MRRPYPTGPSHGLWRGDEVTYGTAHNRLRAARGAASQYQCAHCDQQAREWALTGTDAADRRSVYGRYSTNPDRYVPLCVYCHRLHDDHPWMRNIARQKESDCGRTGNP